MKDITQLHNDAMDLAGEMMVARFQGDADKEQMLAHQAFEKAREAADAIAPELALEPTRSVIHRSAVALAIDANEQEEATRLLIAARQGQPPEAIEQDLKNLEGKIYPKHRLSRTKTTAKINSPIARNTPT